MLLRTLWANQVSAFSPSCSALCYDAERIHAWKLCLCLHSWFCFSSHNQSLLWALESSSGLSVCSTVSKLMRECGLLLLQPISLNVGYFVHSKMLFWSPQLQSMVTYYVRLMCVKVTNIASTVTKNFFSIRMYDVNLNWSSWLNTILCIALLLPDLVIGQLLECAMFRCS